MQQGHLSLTMRQGHSNHDNLFTPTNTATIQIRHRRLHTLIDDAMTVLLGNGLLEPLLLVVLAGEGDVQVAALGGAQLQRLDDAAREVDGTAVGLVDGDRVHAAQTLHLALST